MIFIFISDHKTSHATTPNFDSLNDKMSYIAQFAEVSSTKICCQNFCMTLKSNYCLRNNATEVPLKFQSDDTTPEDSRVCEILW